jgi:hypothetical protein
MTLTDLMRAAELAEQLSRSRHKQLRLVLTARGVAIEGSLLRADDLVVQRRRAEQIWSEGAGDPETLEALIREIDRKLVADWSNAGPAEEP